MRKFLFIGIAVAAISCTPGIKDDGTSNALQTENVSCQYLVYAKDTANPEWMSGFDSQKFFNDVFSHVYAKEVSVLNPNCITFSPSVIFNDTAAPYYDTASLSRDIKWNEQHTVSPEISSIFFFEKWNFDKQTKKLTKKVDYWSPIRRYHNERGDQVLKMMFVKDSKKETTKHCIAADVFYKTPMTYTPNQDESFFVEGLDPVSFVSYLFALIDQEQVKAVDPAFIVDKSIKYFSKQELEKYIGMKINKDDVKRSFFINEYSLIFYEDWYFDESDFSFSKKVKGLALVRMGFEDTPVSKAFKKKILFFILFD